MLKRAANRIKRTTAKCTEEFLAVSCFTAITEFFDAAQVPVEVKRKAVELIDREIDDEEAARVPSFARSRED